MNGEPLRALLSTGQSISWMTRAAAARVVDYELWAGLQSIDVVLGDDYFRSHRVLVSNREHRLFATGAGTGDSEGGVFAPPTPATDARPPHGCRSSGPARRWGVKSPWQPPFAVPY